MPDQLVVDLSRDNNQATVLSWPAGCGTLSRVTVQPAAWPLGSGELDDLRWYLEDYLQAPYGVWEDRGPLVREKLAGWGELVFGAVFAAGPAQEAYEYAREQGLEVVVRSADPGALALPWELMRDRHGPVALAKGGLSRSLPVPDHARTLEVAGGRLRVLMVIARPAGASDVRYQMVARPLLERLNAVCGDVELSVLRPPTFQALREAVQQAADDGRPYHVVHFDGHGGLPAGLGEAVLAFELPGGGSAPVAASRVAAALAAGRVPVAVLNACQSGAMGKELEASVATALLGAGCAAVVAMAYSLYATAAAEFMAAFYEALFSGESVGQAVTAGRRRLFTHDTRPSPKGDVSLADWLVPVHYLRHEVRFPQSRARRPDGGPSLEDVLDHIGAVPAGGSADAPGPLAAADPFVGRDDLFYQLEAAARQQRVVVLSGPGGTGKTELAKGFARWWAATGGVDGPHRVCWHSFEPGVPSFGLDGAVSAASRQLLGSEAARKDPVQRLDAVKQLLKDQRCLLVWDNFESVAEMPDPTSATPPLDGDDRSALRDFLHWVRGHSNSMVIITSRAQEVWLGQVGRVTVGGLNQGEAAEYASYLLRSLPAAQARRQQRSFGELLQWLGGHPLAMRLTLPRLTTAGPADLLAGLQGTSPLPAEDAAGPGRLSSLAASITYSFTHLGDQARRLLPPVSLLHGIADEKVLTAFSAAEGVPSRFAGASQQDWAAALDDGTRVGLLTNLGSGIYQVHPALPGYLAAMWRAEDAAGYMTAREAATDALADAYAEFAMSLVGDLVHSAPWAAATLKLHEKTMNAQLGYALDKKLWRQAGWLAGALQSFWITEGRDTEAAAWMRRVHEAVKDADGAAPAAGSEAGRLWQSFVTAHGQLAASWTGPDDGQRADENLTGHEAARFSLEQQSLMFQRLVAKGVAALDRGELDEAQQWFTKAEAARSGGIEPEPGLGTALSRMLLGTAQLESGQLREAAGSFTQALALKGKFNAAAFVPAYAGLAKICQEIGEMAEAVRWYNRALEAAGDMDDQPRTAMIYKELGILFHQVGDLEGASRWYIRALAIAEELGDRGTVAGCYHQLGMAAYEAGNYEEAGNWYARTLAIAREIDYRRGMAMSYHEHGRLSQQQGQLDEAADWYRKSLAIKEAGGDKPALALTLAQCSLLATEQQRPAEALEFAVRAVTLFDEFPHPSTGTAPRDLTRLTVQLGLDALQQCWRNVTGSIPPQTVLDFIRGQQARPVASEQE